MSATPTQNRRERFAKFLEDAFGRNRSADELRQQNRRVDKRKRKQYARPKP